MDTPAQFATLRVSLLRYAQLQLRDEAAAEDVVQETLLAIHQSERSSDSSADSSATSFRGDSAQLTWATAILKHKLADALRGKYRRVVQVSADEAAHDDAFDVQFTAEGAWAEPVPEWTTPHGQLERHQLRAALEQCLGRLPTNTGRVFMLREWMGFELTEVCSEFKMSADNVRQTMHRARMLMRSCLQHTAFAPTAGSAEKAGRAS